MPPIRLVVFDIAGTIVEDRGEVLDAFASALQGHGIAFTTAELKEWKGASKREVIRHFVQRQSEPANSGKLEQVYSEFRKRLEQHYRENGVTPIAGAANTFAWLRERNIQIATTSGFYREIAAVILETAGWRDTFAANICSNDVAVGRPAPFMIFRAMEATGVCNVREVINVGDTPLDLQAGTNAGVREVIGVLTGQHERERLQRESHTALLPSVAELPGWMEKRYSEQRGGFRTAGP
jgi:phosphonatase-like hydrolase